jgi:hypothetical protein
VLLATAAVVVVAALHAAAPAQTSDEPPPPLLTEPEAAEPPRAAEPSTAEEPPPVLQPAPLPPRIDPAPGGAPKRKAPPPVAVEQQGLNDFIIGFLQWLVPCGVIAVGLPLSVVTGYFCPPVSACAFCLLPAANGYLATYIGDRFGQNRAPALWPVLAAYASTTVAIVGSLAMLFVLNGGGGNFNTPNDPVVLGVLVTGVGVSVASTLAVPLAYGLSSEPKREGDDGNDGPGWFAPHHPRPKKRIDLERDAPLSAMRF